MEHSIFTNDVYAILEMNRFSDKLLGADDVHPQPRVFNKIILAFVRESL